MKANKKLLIPLIAVLSAMALTLGLFALYREGVISPLLFRSTEGLHKADVGETIPYEPEDYCENLILVNGDNTLDPDFLPEVEFYKDTDVLMNSCIIDDYALLSAYINETYNKKLCVSSSYRTYEDQERVYNEEGPEIAALPGTSEHQTGLALDLYVHRFAGAGFIECEAGRYVNSYCQDYGFIIRYPEGAEDITGFSYEPWHIRYVGQPHAEIIAEEGITLEEYFDLFEIGEWYAYEDYLISRQDEDEITIPASCDGNGVIVSPDNTGHVFVTIDQSS
ncbi:MAG: M15 family metallopeptidase [Clostridiales bacterium]|nr:M15 family metallopeptidase [Clostridiales bacterium]